MIDVGSRKQPLGGLGHDQSGSEHGFGDHESSKQRLAGPTGVSYTCPG